MEQVDEFNGQDYEKFIVVSKKELSAFCRLVEPLTKQSIDEYGKCVFFHCIDEQNVELCYTNIPYICEAVVTNKSGKKVRDFAVSVTTLKKLVTQAFASLIFVEQNEDINLAICESLLYLETKNLLADQYKFSKRNMPGSIDKERALHVFRKAGSSLALTERASEKVVVVKNKQVHFNTGVFTASIKSPFSGEEEFVIYKQVSDILAVLAEFSKVSLNYIIDGDTMAVATEGFYVEVQIGIGDKIQEFLSPNAEVILGFNATAKVINDNLLRIITVVGGLEYLSDIVDLEFTKEQLILKISNADQTRTSPYVFNIVEGAPSEVGSMKVSIPVLKLFLAIVGGNCTYDFNQYGLGIKTEDGKYLIRRSS
jgi:hypothetical protein